MTTRIKSNGSKWAGQRPDTIAQLVAVLDAEPLRRRQFDGQFISTIGEGRKLFWGNFLTLSHVFNIETNDPKVIRTLTNAINRNRRRRNYREQ